MKRLIYTAFLFFLLRPAEAQKGISGLIRAEKDFAAYSVARSTKEAFELYIDSNSIMFDKGEPVKAMVFWNSREKRPGILDWHPQFAEISVSGDFGYTTGPWTFRNSPADTVIARGQYATVWHLDQQGNWKFLVDLGIDNTQPGSVEERIIDAAKQPETYTGNLHPLAAAEADFNRDFLRNHEQAYASVLSEQCILARNGHLPAADPEGRRTIINATPGGVAFTTRGMGGSPVPDMGYTFGSYMINGQKENYLRIWRREKAGWRIALEVLRY